MAIIPKALLGLLGLLSVFVGVLVVTPTQKRIWALHIALNEHPWMGVIPGAFAAIFGLFGKKRTPAASILGFTGAALSLWPYTKLSSAASDMEQSMRLGLGEDYQQTIPKTAAARMAPARLSLPVTFGTRDRISAPATYDVVFSDTPQRPLKLDIYQPTVQPAVGTLYPAIINVHGGSWYLDDKGGYFTRSHRYYASQGYVVFDIQYRLSTEAIWPAQLHDIQDAVRWVRANAARYSVDPEQIALMGRSAGGHLALMAAYRQPDSSVEVKAVVAYYPPTDLRMWRTDGDSSVVTLLGGTPHTAGPMYDDASPIHWVRDNLPPTLIAQGYMDELVVPQHAEVLYNRLLATNTPAVLLRVPWGRHGFDALTTMLGAQVSQFDIDRFLAWSLYRKFKA